MGTKTLTLLSLLCLISYKIYAQEGIRYKETKIIKDYSEEGLTVVPDSYILYTNTNN